MRKGLADDTLFLACTRPAMTLGVPIEALAIIMIVTTLIFIVMVLVLLFRPAGLFGTSDRVA